MIYYILLITIFFTQPFTGDYGIPKEKQFLCNTIEEINSIIADEESKMNIELGDGWKLKFQIYKIDLENKIIKKSDFDDFFIPITLQNGGER